MKKKKELSEKEIYDIWEFYHKFREDPVLLKLYQTPQHRTSNTFRHVCLVASESLKHALKKKLDIDYYSLIRGAFLHDLFFTNWRNKKHFALAFHLHRHPKWAYENAKQYFEINEIEKDIILNHMWPITLSKFPHTKEGKIVMMMDKKATFAELFSHKGKVLIFDLDGTLVDTLDDLTNAVNYALKKSNYKKVDKEFVRLAIGNGVKTLLNRCCPDSYDNDKLHQKLLNDFTVYYNKHLLDNTYAYPGMKETLKKFKRYGFRLTVATNKTQVNAIKIINALYPNMFSYIQGDDQKTPLKPNPAMIHKIANEYKINNYSKIYYIGDTQVDYTVAKNAAVEHIIVSYGFRTREEQLSLDIKGPFVSSPYELLSILRIKTNKK